jgi:hypothetical protein
MNSFGERVGRRAVLQAGIALGIELGLCGKALAQEDTASGPAEYPIPGGVSRGSRGRSHLGFRGQVIAGFALRLPALQLPF